MARLGINIDHVATVRQARGEDFPDPVEAAVVAVMAGADGITAHLREDRRHIQDDDLKRLRKELNVPLNMEMAATPEIISIAEQIKPAWVCLVPEKRRELTTEGGLDLNRDAATISSAIERVHAKGIKVSLFIEPDESNVIQSKKINADAVELHTGVYAWSFRKKESNLAKEMDRIRAASKLAAEKGLLVNAGHGIDFENVQQLMSIHPFHELNIGFAVIARAVFTGLGQAVKEMKEKMK